MDESTLVGGFAPSPVAPPASLDGLIFSFDAPASAVSEISSECGIEVVAVDEFLTRLSELYTQTENPIPAMEVPFSQYSLTDTLLVFLIVLGLLSFLWSVVKEVF